MSITIGTVTINTNPAFGTQFWTERFNQYNGETADGGVYCVDNGPNIIKGILILNLVAKSEGDSLRTYLTGTAYFGKVSFTITPPANTDLGKGVGTVITVYYNGGNSIESVFEYVAPGRYNIRLPYKEAI